MNDSEATGGVVSPRLSDVFGLVIKQDEVDFVAPHLREDLPPYLDPFLLWKSDRPDYPTVHTGFGEQDGFFSVFLNGPVIKVSWDADDTSWRYAYLRDLTIDEEA